MLDALELLQSELENSNLKREKHVSEFLEWTGPFVQRAAELRIRRSDFDVIRVIGRGAFGEVSVVKMKSTNKEPFFNTFFLKITIMTCSRNMVSLKKF